MRRWRSGVVLLLLLILLAAILLLVNPFNWSVKKSARFSFGRFARVERGMQIDQVVNLLGPPLRVVNGIGPPLCPNGPTCRNFVFADEAKPWVMAHKKAWVIVDDKGLVVKAIAYAEP